MIFAEVSIGLDSFRFEEGEEATKFSPTIFLDQTKEIKCTTYAEGILKIFLFAVIMYTRFSAILCLLKQSGPDCECNKVTWQRKVISTRNLN